MRRELAGLKIRALRKAAGLTQGELARRAGISAPYLNLIEANKRAVAGDAGRPAGERPRGRARRHRRRGRAPRVVHDLDEIAADPTIAEPAAPGAGGGAGRPQPGLGRPMLRLYRAYQDQRQAVLALADRLSRDPFLGESVHRILTHVTAIRSAAEILQSGDGLDPADRAALPRRSSRRTARRSRRRRALARRLLRQRQHPRPLGHARPSSSTPSSSSRQPLPRARGAGRRLPSRTAATARPDDAPRESRRARPKRRRRGRGDAVAAIVAAHPALAADEARAQAASALHAYVAGAALMPYEPFLEAAERSRYDIDALSRRFGVSYEQAAHRLATLAPPRRRRRALRLHALRRVGLS